MARKSKKPVPYDARPFTINVPANLKKIHEAIEWYFTQAEADMGIESNWSAMVAVWAHATTPEESAESQMVSSIDRRRSHDSILAAAGKYRRVSIALATLSTQTKIFLQTLFYEKEYPRSLEGILGRTTHAVMTLGGSWEPTSTPDVIRNAQTLLAARRRVEAGYIDILTRLEAQCTS